MFENREPEESSMPKVQVKQNQIAHEQQNQSKLLHFVPFLPSLNSLQRSIKTIGNYQFSFDHKLGSGLTSDAYVGINKLTNETVCIKIVDKQIFKKPEQKLLMQNEIKCQRKVSSDFIVKVYDVIQTNSFSFIVTELCDEGDLYRIIQQTNAGMGEDKVIRIGKDIANAMLSLKNNCIVHRDIKPQNILIKKGRGKLGDFGFAIEQKNLLEREKSSIGSPLYMSLETLLENRYSYSSDVFAYGVMIYEMLHKQSPWECSDEMELIKKMQTEEISFKNGLSEEIKTLIRRCLNHDIQNRIKIEEIVSCSIFKDTL